MHTLFIPVFERSLAMPIEKPLRRWPQRCNEFGEVDSIREAAVFFARAEKRFSLKEIPCLEQLKNN